MIGKTATKVFNEDGITTVRYHDTDIVQFTRGTIYLNTGGWFTATTKRRMNQTSDLFDLGYTVYQRDFTWHVDYKDETFKFTGNSLVLER
jgi:hypothetical protein